MDTNALFLPIRAGFPLEAEIARILPGAPVRVTSSTLRELDRLESRGTPGARGARQFADRLPTTPTRLDGDAAILDVARRRRAIVVTADRELARRLRAEGLGVLMPRDRHRLELRPGDGPEPPARRPRARPNR